MLRTEADPSDTIPWHVSEAKKILKRDINDGKHLQFKPLDFHVTREEYKTFSLKVFRNRIYQEVDSRSKRATRFAKKKIRSGPTAHYRLLGVCS